MINIDDFINRVVINRQESMFSMDLENNKHILEQGIAGRKVLVIGGAGSIGSSFIKALLSYKPDELVVVDTNENALTELTRDLRSSGRFVPDNFITYPMNYGSTTFYRMFRHHGRFDIVANFSAHKHVRSEKDIFSIEAMITNNLFEAEKFLEFLCDYPPEEYFCVSTDKAANPVNIMGASKRIMEDLIFAFSDVFPVKTARFANVAFSNGSLPDGFLKRLDKRQPLSAPNDVKRYFVSPEEAGQICLMSCVLGNNREIFFPKLDESTMSTFDSIALKLLKELGYTAHYCNSDDEAIGFALNMSAECKEYPVYFSGADTSGEKQYEEFYVDGENVDWDSYLSMGIIEGKEKTDRRKVQQLIAKLRLEFESPEASKENVVGLISGYLQNFEHIETGLSLDKKM